MEELDEADEALIRSIAFHVSISAFLLVFYFTFSVVIVIFQMIVNMQFINSGFKRLCPAIE